MGDCGCGEDPCSLKSVLFRFDEWQPEAPFPEMDNLPLHQELARQAHTRDGALIIIQLRLQTSS